MSQLLFIDSFDHYSVAQGSRKWTTFSGFTTLVAGRTGNGLNGSGGNLPGKTLGGEYATLTAGVAYKTQAFANSILIFNNVAPSIEFSLAHLGDGRLYLAFQGASSSPSTFVMNLNEWYYFEAQATIDGGPPYHVTASARVNGIEILTWDYTGATGSAGAKWARVELQAPGGGNTATVDDFYCTDDEFLGDIQIGVLYPNAAGDSSAWTPSGAGANWQQVEEHPADDDTTYVSTPTVDALDLYNLDDIDPAFEGAIKGAQALWLVKKSDEGAAVVKGQWKSEGVIVEGEEFAPSALNYLYSIQAARNSLFTLDPWTPEEINALQIGVKRTV